jgi:glutamyl-tRNA reductase
MAIGTKDKATEKTHEQDADRKELVKEFKALVNMTPKALEKWLDSSESKEVGQKSSDKAESIGHQSGKHIIQILEKKASEYTDNDYDHMKRVVSYIKRHSAQKPKSDIEDSNWRYSLMNWGYDPTK